MERTYKFEWIPAALAAAAFIGFVVAFLYELFSYQELAIGWANGDINSRAHLAAAHLAEPLRTQDFRAIQKIGNACEADGVHLMVTSARGGVVFDSCPRGTHDLPFYSERCPSGEYWVSIGMPQARVLAPFKQAIRGFFMAGFVGVAGVLLFFFVTYRQRVRIRELKRLEQFRRDFIADVSHEIKTPLTGILGAVDLLGEKVKVEGQGQQWKLIVSLIKKESVRLNGLVQSILDLAKLEREGEVLNLVETDVAELIRAIAVRHGVAFIVDAESFPRQMEGSTSFDAAGTPRLQVRCDPQLVEQAVENLVVNAVRHSGTDDITVFLASDAKSVRIAVEDHGIGIPLEHAKRIFERFHRVDPARASETGGAGLGLAIVRRIARLHGGDVVCSPVSPHGSRFEIFLKMLS